MKPCLTELRSSSTSPTVGPVLPYPQHTITNMNHSYGQVSRPLLPTQGFYLAPASAAKLGEHAAISVIPPPPSTIMIPGNFVKEPFPATHVGARPTEQCTNAWPWHPRPAPSYIYPSGQMIVSSGSPSFGWNGAGVNDCEL